MDLRNVSRWVAIGGLVLCIGGLLVASVAPVPKYPVTVAALVCGVVGMLAGVYYVDAPPSETPLGRAADKMRDPKFREQLKRAEGED